MNKSKSIRLLISILLTLILTSVTFPQYSSELTPNEKKRVSAFVTYVYKELQRTRDTSVFLNQPPADVIFKESKTFDESIIRKRVANIVSHQKLKQFYIAQINLIYLAELYYWSNYPDASFQGREDEEKYPIEIFKFLKRNSLSLSFGDLNKPIDSLNELNKEVIVLRKASAMMRKYFISHPPEKSKLYQKNVLPYERNITLAKVYYCGTQDMEKDCLGMPKNTKVISVFNLPIIGMMLMEIKGRYRVLMFGKAD